MLKLLKCQNSLIKTTEVSFLFVGSLLSLSHDKCACMRAKELKVEVENRAVHSTMTKIDKSHTHKQLPATQYTRASDTAMRMK